VAKVLVWALYYTSERGLLSVIATQCTAGHRARGHLVLLASHRDIQHRRYRAIQRYLASDAGEWAPSISVKSCTLHPSSEEHRRHFTFFSFACMILF